MPTPTLIATPAAADANSYCTVAEADVYHDARLSRSGWAATGTDADNKTVALIMATRVLDAVYVWAGWATQAQMQALQWPRTGLFARNEQRPLGVLELPLELKHATAELARQLLAADRTLDSDIETQGITSLKAGPVSLMFKEGVTAKVVPDAVYSLLPPSWGYVRGRRTGVRVLERA